ncbi:MAG: lipopolysaccharide biosynthesis protein [Bacteroidales bacterium]|nr:lipopolysaccharide biosynthesis protein [Bacteroidales bacterium]
MASPSNISENSRRIARNTAFLYIRMLILLFVGLYTSRVVLNALGQDDYGVYGAVGGVVSLFLVVTGAVSGAISRFLAFELGKEKSRMREVFSTTVSIQLALSVVVFLLAEVVGLWLLHTQMDIPEGRMQAAQWVLHCSILLFVVNMLSVPYNAAIIAHEKMDAFAYISIGEALLALGAALATRYTRHDKLIVYAVLMLTVAVIVRAVYNLYAHRHFPECRFRLKSIDRTVIREIGSFTGWTFIGSVASVLNAHGINLLMNIFFGVRVNAARDVTTKLESNVSRFINNITTAINPQINKSYAAGRLDYMHQLVCKASKYSYFLYFFFALPLILEAPALLKLWLNIVPDHSVAFVRIALLTTLFTALGTPFVNAIFATGNVKRYEIIASVTNVLAFPLSYLAFKLGMSPEWAYWLVGAVSLGLLVERIVMACRQTGMRPGMVWKDVLLPSLVVTLTAAIIPMALFLLQPPSVARMLEVVFSGFLCTAVCSFFFGATAGERDVLVSKIKSLI